MILGFTGTQEGMSDGQKAEFARKVRHLQPVEFHHGDCVGADAEAHELVRVNVPSCVIHSHPPTDERRRAFCKADVVHPAKDFIPRNHDIVDECDFLFAAPRRNEMELRSGTWATYRYALECLKGHEIIER